MKNTLKFLLSILILVGVIAYFLGGGIEKQVVNEVDRIELQLAEDAIKQYEIAKRNGSNMDAYTEASYVAAAFLQAKDEVNYKKWKEIEKEEAKKLGL